MYRFFTLATTLAALLSACKDTPEKIPSYIRIEPFVVNAQGNASWHKITDGWLYVNGEYLGAYTLPAEVPVIAEGPCDIIVFPGVKENGIATSPNIYPNLTRWDGKDVLLTPAQTTVIQPSTVYDQRTVFPFGAGRGDFDGGSNIVIENRDDDPDNGFSITADSAFFGKCILMQVDTAHPLLDIATEKVINIPVTGSPEVWVEMHYKCDIPYFLYIAYPNGGSESIRAVYQFNTSANWNKIYINLTETLTDVQTAQFRLYFRASLTKDGSGKYPQLKGSVRIDNIRIAHL